MSTKHLLIIRPEPSGQQLKNALQSHVPAVSWLPLFELKPRASLKNTAIESLTKSPVWVFSSPYAVELLHQQFNAVDARAHNDLKSQLLFGVGDTTRQAITEYFKTKKAILSDTVGLQALVESLEFQQALKQSHQTFTLIGAKTPQQNLLDSLRASGIKIEEFVLYEALPKDHAPSSWQDYQSTAVDSLYCSSAQTMSRLFDIFDKPGKKWLQSLTWLVTSSRLVDKARSYSVQDIVLINDATNQTLINYFLKSR